ncbi:MAG: hypothetical protein V7K96_13885 [Nostoc sp.]
MRSHTEDFAGDRFFYEPQRRREHRERRERSHAEDFAGDRSFQRTTETQRKKSAIAWWRFGDRFF